MSQASTRRPIDLAASVALARPAQLEAATIGFGYRVIETALTARSGESNSGQYARSFSSGDP